MPALDQCHNQIVHTLQKSGWSVSNKPYVLYIASQRRVYIDIYAYRDMGNDKQRLVIIEAKCFADNRSELNDLYTAIGQYLLYRTWLKTIAVTDELYLAVPKLAFDNLIIPLASTVIRENRVKMIVIDLENEVIEQWMD